MDATALAPRTIARDLWLLAEPSQLSRAREFAEEAAEELGFDEDESYAFKFAANEAVANAIEHGEPCHDGTIRLRVRATRDALSFYVRDCGAFAPWLNGGPDKGDRGRGFVFMAAMTDRVEIRPRASGTVVLLIKRRPGAE